MPAPTIRNPVRLLSPELCNQIAAGEVLERPASAVKELVENALDAGARTVLVDLEDGGRTLIRVVDDGSGMGPDDAELALQRHATSKIRTVEDLSSINTLGFRGEALASIASVSRMSLVTQPHDTELGCRFDIEGGAIVDRRAYAAPPGTHIDVRDLFFNTPARLKFLKRVPTEVRRVQEAMLRLAMARHDVRFRLTHDGRKRLDVPAHRELGDRLLALLGRETFEGLYALPDGPGMRGAAVSGYFGSPTCSTRGAGSQFTFVNGRFVSDRTIQAAIQAAYRELLPKGRSAVVALFLDVPAELVDVNVHPAKTEVRFEDTDAIFRTVYRPLREGLAAAPWAGDGDQRARTVQLPGDGGREQPVDGVWGATATYRQRDLDGVYGGDTPAWVNTLLDTGRAGPPVAFDTPLARQGDPSPPPIPGSTRYFSRLRYIGQLARAYLLTTDGHGLVVIDQHAAHERISYERLRISWRGRSPESQQLLFPVQVELDTLRAAALEEHADLFAELGFDIDPFGGNAFAIKAVPGILAGTRYEAVIRDALDDLSQIERTSRVEEAVESVLSRMACHGSVRAGDDLTAEEAYALFAQMDQIDFKANCPHGRPVYFKIGTEELEKRFDRR